MSSWNSFLVLSVFHWQHIEFLDICIDVIVNDIGIGLALLLRIWNECEKPAPFCQLFVLLLLAAPSQVEPEACQLPCHWPGLPNYSEIQWRVPSLTNTVACVSMLTCITWQCCPASPAGLQFKLPVHHVLPYVCLSCHHVSLTCVSSVFHWQHILDICIDVIDIGIGFATSQNLKWMWKACTILPVVRVDAAGRSIPTRGMPVALPLTRIAKLYFDVIDNVLVWISNLIYLASTDSVTKVNYW